MHPIRMTPGMTTSATATTTMPAIPPAIKKIH